MTDEPLRLVSRVLTEEEARQLRAKQHVYDLLGHLITNAERRRAELRREMEALTKGITL